MQGASLQSARLDMARDQVARKPRPAAGLAATMKQFGWMRLVKSGTPGLIIVTLGASRNPQNSFEQQTVEALLSSIVHKGAQENLLSAGH
jgi:hypothetical protein